MLVGLLVVTAPGAPSLQKDGLNFVRLFRLDGTFSEELSTNIRSDDKSKNPGFALTAARLEADNFGFLTRLRSLLTIDNGNNERRITEVEWRLDVYDASLRTASVGVVQSDKVNIYPGETAVASAKFGAVLPDKMVVLLQLSRVSYADGSVWLPVDVCYLGQDLTKVSCKPN